jgi:hypothetical protein
MGAAALRVAMKGAIQLARVEILPRQRLIQSFQRIARRQMIA